jgi:hypothetical protein
MKNYCSIIIACFLLLFGINESALAQKTIESQISDSLTAIANSFTRVGKVAVTNFSVNTKANRLVVTANERLGYIALRPDNVKRIYNAINSITSAKYPGFGIVCQVDNINIEDLIPNFYRTNNTDKNRQFRIQALSTPLVTNISRPFDIVSGLQNRHIALWQSHGWHYDQKLARWEWQRARIFQTVEDLYTQAYVLPFLAPMLENAGANVLIPRERDTQLHEIIVDNDMKDSESRYREHNDRKVWRTGEGKGFENERKKYLQGENPFQLGTYRLIPSVVDENESSRAEWTPYIPETGRYAVYVSYKTIQNSVPDARYSVIHKGGTTDFVVNQTMNGGTWVYLGHFFFEKGKNANGKVILTNLCSDEGKFVTADAVKFGGGMGNIARSPNENGTAPNQKSSENLSTPVSVSKPPVIYEPETSGYPRFIEGARYWLQWAGMPVAFTAKIGEKRLHRRFPIAWTLGKLHNGGSPENPSNSGLRVPIDLAFAFHTDAEQQLMTPLLAHWVFLPYKTPMEKPFFKTEFRGGLRATDRYYSN